jgi:hypothetical protein
MTRHYKEEDLYQIFSSPDFITANELYQVDNKSTIDELTTFLNTIHLNSQYFRLGIKHKKYKTNVCSDTLHIKELNQCLNKLTDQTFDSLYTKIVSIITTNKHLLSFVIENLFSKCISQPTYIETYVRLLERLTKETILSLSMINSKLTICKECILNVDYESKNQYEELCDRNKKLDNSIGYYILVSYLEKYKLIQGHLLSISEELVTSISTNKEKDIRYEYIQCLYTILTINSTLDISPLNLQELIKKETSMKNKFKLEDIYNIITT